MVKSHVRFPREVLLGFFGSFISSWAVNGLGHIIEWQVDLSNADMAVIWLTISFIILFKALQTGSDIYLAYRKADFIEKLGKLDGII